MKAGSVWAVVLGVGLAACEEAQDLSAAEWGAQLARSSSLSKSQFNQFSCMTCHTEGAEDGPIASSLRNAYDRERWWGGQIISLFEAVDYCYVAFMRGYPSLNPDSDEAQALQAWLRELSSGEPLPARPLTIVETITDPGPGDKSAGEAIYVQSCQSCHGSLHSGRNRLGDEVPILPEESLAFAAELNVSPRLVVAEKVRHGQFFGISGMMPFWSLEAMSDSELADLLAYVLDGVAP